jgi:hypothetical protein
VSRCFGPRSALPLRLAFEAQGAELAARLAASPPLFLGWLAERLEAAGLPPLERLPDEGDVFPQGSTLAWVAGMVSAARAGEPAAAVASPPPPSQDGEGGELAPPPGGELSAAGSAG